MNRRLVATLSFITLLIVVPACGVNGLSFKQDKRVEITSPSDRASVRLPVTVKWKVTDDFDITGNDGSRKEDSGYFGVFVDSAPPPPHKTFAWIARNDPFCRPSQGCPGTDYFTQLNIFSTTETSIVLTRIPDLNPQSDRRDFHQVTVILLNGRGERIGESAFRVEFEVKR